MAFRLATMNDRAVLIAGEGIYDLERHSQGRFSADPMQAIARHEALHDVDRCSRRRGGCSPRIRRARRLRTAAAEGVRHRPQLPLPRRRVGHGGPPGTGGVHQVSELSHRSDRRRHSLRADDRLGGRARRRDRQARPRHRRGGRVEGDRRFHLRPGRLRADDAVRRQAATVRSRQVVRHLRADRPRDRIARPARRSERSGDHLRHQRRGSARAPARAT